MKKKYYIIIGIIVLLGILIFFIMGFLGRQNMVREVVVDYPKINDPSVQYDKRLFDDNYMHEVNVVISEDDWKDLIDNPLDETKYKVDITIDGVTINTVSFKTKGNSSLKNIAEGPGDGPASNRYSFKVDFDKYVDNQTYFGLDTLNLNNIFGDATYLNDYIGYDVFKMMGVASPLNSFVYLKINGRPFGVYCAVEEISDSFLKRNNLSGNLYKPEQSNGRDNGSSLKYKNDKTTSYSDIFSNSKNSITVDDQHRMIKSLRTLNSYSNIDSVVNTDYVIRYFAAHNFLLSYDSYTGKSIHNYYLLEKDGKLSMLPWDYNLSFGRFNMTQDINTIVNYGIDSPLSMANNEDRPMWYWILLDDNYLNEYHRYMNELIVNYFESGYFEKKLDKITNLIDPYVKQDMSAFYTYDQFKTANSTLKDFCNNRAKSIRLQLDGKLSTITSEQDNNARIDSSSIDLNNMGLVADDSKRQG